MLSSQQWFPVKGFEDRYEVSVEGAVRNARNGRLLSPVGRKYTLSDKKSIVRLTADELRDSSVLSLDDLLSSAPERTAPFVLRDAQHPTALIGSAGEHLVCFELAMRGVMACCNVVPGAPYDVVADFGGGVLFTIQVKTAGHTVAKAKRGRTAEEYRFKKLSSVSSAVDAYAFVSLSQQAVVLELPERIKGDVRVFASEASFAARAGRSIDELLPVLYSRVKR